MKHTFLHKRHKTQKIAADPKWTDLLFIAGGVTRKRFYCDADGTLEAELYLPVEYRPQDQSLTGQLPSGVLRVRLVREAFKGKPTDPTGYDEAALLPDLDGYARVRFAYRGEAERGRRYYWQAQVLGDLDVTATGTHYAQFWRT